MRTLGSKAPEHGGLAAGYRVAEVATWLDWPVSRIHACVRAGFVSPRRGGHGEYRLSFQDVVLLRTARDLLQQVPLRKVKRALDRLREQLPRGRGLAGVRLTLVGDTVVVRDGARSWDAESGQARLDFDLGEVAAQAAPLVRQAADEARRAPASAYDADDWFDLASALETCDPEQAREAYRRLLEIEPSHAAGHLNLGRLLHEAGELSAAEAHYRTALVHDPEDATAVFNLGVVLEDLGRKAEAVQAYEQALRLDPTYADAHYNLAHLYEQLGQPRPALRHLQDYRALTHPA